MKHSIYNICLKNKNGNYIAYNTFTTSLVEFDEPFYNKFLNMELLKSEVDSLYEMGFLVKDDEDELLRQNLIRINASYQDYNKVAGVFIAPTMACNARCSYCYESGIRHKSMNKQTVEAVKEFLLKYHVTDRPIWINWFGGEPTLAIETILDISDYLIDNNIDFVSNMTTNAYLLTKDVLVRIKDRIKLEHLQITVDAIGEEYNKIKNYIYKDTNPFDIIMKNIEDILSFKDIQVGIRINFHPNEIDRAEKILDYLNKRFAHCPNISIYTAPITSVDVPSIFEKFNCENPMFTLLKKTLAVGKDKANSGKQDFDEYRYSLMTPIGSHCYATRIHAYAIDADGLLYKCHRQLGRGKDHAVGDVFSGVEYNSNYRFWCGGDLPYEECATCKLLPFCQGGCHIELKSSNSNAKCCRLQKNFLSELITYLYELDK